jgi:hypothetical protein
MKKEKMREKYLKEPPCWILGTIKRERVEFVRYNRESLFG